MGERPNELWNRPDRQAVEGRRGALFDQAQRLSGLMHAEHKHLKVQKEAGGTRLVYPQYEFHGGSPTRRQLVEVHVVEGDPNIYLAHDPDISNDDMHRYSITPDGVISDVDYPQSDIPVDSEQFAGIRAAMHHVSNELELDQGNRLRAARERRSKVTKTVSTVAVLAVLGGGGYLGLKKFVFDPMQAERDASAAYDSQPHTLPGEVSPIDTYDFGVLSKDDFVKIPELEDEEESIYSPRTVELGSTSGCKKIDVKAVYTDTFVAAVQKGSELEDLSYQISTTDSGIKICVVDHNIEGTVAVQTIPAE